MCGYRARCSLNAATKPSISLPVERDLRIKVSAKLESCWTAILGVEDLDCMVVYWVELSGIS